MITSRRNVLGGIVSAALLPAAIRAQATDAVTPEAFGARGDGRTNDTDAFAAMSDYVNARGGGTIVLRPVTYIVGRHGDRINTAETRRNGPFAFPPARILQFANCSRPIVVRGNGARLRAASGLRFGSFDPRTGRRLDPALPFIKRQFRGSPYIAMIEATGCTGLIDISDLELDGNLGALEVGGKWGDAGWQVPGNGIWLTSNTGPERLAQIYTHHHPADGLIITGANRRSAESLIADVTSEDNGRQGCSITGGRNYVFERCRFRRTGRAGIWSAPGAGVDIEAQLGFTVRNLRFSQCEFSDNAGSGLLAHSGDSAGAVFDGCTFIGTTNWSAWPNKPRFRFSGCTFVGSLVHAFPTADPSQAAQFHGCRFLDDPALSPTRRVYGSTLRARPIVILLDGRNVLFNRCDFALTNDCSLPVTTGSIYSDCTMSQRSPAQSRPRGTWLGTNIIRGNADLAGSIVRGAVRLNGRAIPRTG